jgi:hypothetical protein
MGRPRQLTAIALATVAALILTIAVAAAASAGGRPFSTGLDGESELAPGTLVPGAGDLDATGEAHLRLNPGQGTVCFDITTDGIVEGDVRILFAHIHRGTAAMNGPVVVLFFDFAAQGGTTEESFSGCAPADRRLVSEIIRNPEGFYVNVHSTEFVPGAVRGQLSKK